MKKVGKILLAIIVIDYVRIAVVQSYTGLMRVFKKDEAFWPAMRKVAPSWKDEVTFHENLEEEEV